MSKVETVYNRWRLEMRASWPSCLVVLGLFCVVWAPAKAAMSVYGSSQAMLCYEHAEAGSIISSDCDDALKDDQMTQHDRASTLVNRGIIYNSARKVNRALADFDAALAIIPELPEAFLNRGNSRFYQNRLDDALADYTRAIDLKIERLSAAYYNRALAYGSLGRLKEAKADLEAALAIDPDFKEAQGELDFVSRLLAASSGPAAPAKTAAPGQPAPL